jgi:hypothetical protein
MRNLAGVRTAFVSMIDSDGTPTNINSALAAGSVDHTLRLEVDGNDYSLYVDDVLVGSNSFVGAGITEVQTAFVTITPVVSTSDIAIEYLEISNNAIESDSAGHRKGRWRNKQIYVAKYQGEYYEFHDSEEFEEFVQNKMAEEIAAGDVPDGTEVKPRPPKAKIPGWVRRALRKNNAD